MSLAIFLFFFIFFFYITAIEFQKQLLANIEMGRNEQLKVGMFIKVGCYQF